MAEYIERSKVLKSLGEEPLVWTDDDSLIQEYADWVKHVDAIKAIPAADVVEVVRCKDCKHKERAAVNDKGFLICPASGMEITDYDFCSYGERKEKNDI